MRFEKWHGIGNDFILFADPDDHVTLTPDLVKSLCDRRFGIGGDGVIRVTRGRAGGELFMDYVNSDGSIGEMCGNGIRCLALFAREQGLTSSDEIKVETRAGIKVLYVEDDIVRADMGPPIFDPSEIPVVFDGTDPLHARIELETEGPLEVAALSMGNPHAVLFVDDPDEAPVTTVGPLIEHHGAFPHGANVEFVRVLSPERIRMRVWERGSGETLACGTGACAAAVAAKLLADCGDRMTVELPGGEVEVEWAGSLTKESPVYLSGPAVKSFTGEVEI